MATDNETKFNIADFVNREIPAEIIEQLRIAGRVQQVLTPTQTSAVSTSVQEDEAAKGAPDPDKELDDLIDGVDELEDLTEQLEDLIDEHLKDMKIPPANDTIAQAAKDMGSEDGTITQDVLDNSLAAMDYLPMMTLGQDPVLACLIGDGTIEGDWVECNEITAELAKKVRHPARDEYEAEQSIKDSSTKMADDHEKRMIEMILEILLQLWWNMLWPKFVVDMGIINPLRMAIAYPVDSVIGFFKKKRFRRKNKSWLKNKGPVNKALNQLRIFLLCKIPPPLYPRYDPIVEINCGGITDECPPEFETDSEGNATSKSSVPDEKGSVGSMGDYIDSAVDELCSKSEELLENVDRRKPEGFGSSPRCVKSAKIVLDAVVADALTPPDGEYKPGGAGSNRETITNTIDYGQSSL